jgi:cytosine/adenosine deaminase-related metal-dependent hydrolase
VEEGIVIYSADLTLPIASPPISDGAVAVRGSRVLFAGKRPDVIDDLKAMGLAYTERRFGGIIAPGLVNAHTHLQYTGMGALGSFVHKDFHEWALAFNDVYEPLVKASNPPWRDWALDGARRLIESGTAAAADVVTNPEAADALSSSGLDGLAYWEVINETNEDWADCKRSESEHRILGHIASFPRIPGAGISPHAPYSLDKLPLLELPGIARRNRLRLHMHLLESPMEKEMDDPCRQYRDWHSFKAKDFSLMRLGGNGESSLRYADRLGLLGPDCHIAHGVYATKDDLEILRKRGTSTALCPRSNFIAGLDEPPVALYLSEGNPIAIGTDSLSSSPSLDLMDDVAALSALAKKQGYGSVDLPRRLLAAATLGGAAALGRASGEGRIGCLCPGALAHLAFFNISAGRGESGVNEALSELAESGGGKCACTIIGGEIKYQAENTWL